MSPNDFFSSDVKPISNAIWFSPADNVDFFSKKSLLFFILFVNETVLEVFLWLMKPKPGDESKYEWRKTLLCRTFLKCRWTVNQNVLIINEVSSLF